MSSVDRITKTLSDPDSGLRRRLRAGLRSVLPQWLIWRRALPSEVAFWSKFLATGGLDHPGEYARRFDPQTQLIEPLILEVIDDLPSDRVRILDVGAGPATSLGYRHADHLLEIVAVDALGDEYGRLLAENGLTPVVPTIACPGERLLERFAPGSFDIAHARNSLDHSARPTTIIANMLTLVRAGGWVLLRHYAAHAQDTRYEELHQWNFDIENGRPMIWNRRARHDLQELLGDRATVSGAIDPPWMTCRLQKRTA